MNKSDNTVTKSSKSIRKPRVKKSAEDKKEKKSPCDVSNKSLRRKKKDSKNEKKRTVRKTHPTTPGNDATTAVERSVMQPEPSKAGTPTALTTVAGAAGPGCNPDRDRLTHDLILPEALQGKLYDPETDERSIKGRDPDNPTPEQLKRLNSYVEQCIATGAKGLEREFEAVKMFNVDLPASTTVHQAHPEKNRYKDIFCIDQSRVVLKDANGNEDGYINANWVRGPPFLNDFICTQGPLEATIVDFWRMVVQENVGFIVMLCDTVELGKKKCERYIPDSAGESVTFGDYKITLIKSLVDGHFTNSLLTLEVPDGKSRIVYHHQWRNWPDRGVPLTALAGLRVLRQARLTKSTTVVHCSAGVGRTGTLVAIEYMMQQIITSDGPYDMREMVKALRKQRAHAIQTAPQYAYVAQAILRKMVALDPSSADANAKYQAFAADMKGPPTAPKQ